MSTKKVRRSCRVKWGNTRRFWPIFLMNELLYLFFRSILSDRCAHMLREGCPFQMPLTCRVWLRRRFWAESCKIRIQTFLWFFFFFCSWRICIAAFANINHYLPHNTSLLQAIMWRLLLQAHQVFYSNCMEIMPLHGNNEVKMTETECFFCFFLLAFSSFVLPNIIMCQWCKYFCT